MKSLCTFIPGIAINPISNQSPKQEHWPSHDQSKHRSQQQVAAVQLNQEHRDSKMPHAVTLFNKTWKSVSICCFVMQVVVQDTTYSMYTTL